MKNATLLVVIGKLAKPIDLESLSEVARAQNLHLNVLVLGAMPPIPVYSGGFGMYGSYAIPSGWQDEIDKTNAILKDLRGKISQYLADQGASAEVRVISGDIPALSDTVARYALACDMVVLGDDLRTEDSLFADVLRAALFRAPAGVLLNGMKKTSVLQPRSVFVAWKTGLASARAIRAALPLLRAATEVTVAIFDPVTTPWREGENPGADIATWLSHHGCAVTVQQYPTSGEDIADVLKQRAKDTGADLIVMGAYDHSRLREVVFGGTTRTLVEQQNFPVMLCH
jgi:nucleotide-binding universal stress UspA family protein